MYVNEREVGGGKGKLGKVQAVPLQHHRNLGGF